MKIRLLCTVLQYISHQKPILSFASLNVLPWPLLHEKPIGLCFTWGLLLFIYILKLILHCSFLLNRLGNVAHCLLGYFTISSIWIHTNYGILQYISTDTLHLTVPVDDCPGKNFLLIFFLYQDAVIRLVISRWSPVVYQRAPLHIFFLWKPFPAYCIMQCLSWSLVYWKNMLIFSCFMYSLSCNAYPVLKVIVRLSCTMSMNNLCSTRFRWKAYATRSFMKSLSCKLMFGESLSYTVLWKVHSAH